MLLRASLFVILAFGALAACGAKKGGKLMTDTPVLPYKQPDVEELSGTSEDEPETPPPAEPKAEAPAPNPAMATPPPPPAPPPAKTPAPPPPPAKK